MKNDLYLGFEITIENLNTKESIRVSDSDFTLKDEDGRQYSAEWLLSDRINGIIPVARKTRGTLWYDVKKNDLYYLYYQLNQPEQTVEVTLTLNFTDKS